MNNAAEAIAKYFPQFYTEEEFIEKTFRSLSAFGFSAENSIASVCICRDEISQSFSAKVSKYWGVAFNLASLGGMFIAGKTALNAAIHHAPENVDKRRYVFYALPHIAIGIRGELGLCSRPGIDKSTACGALAAFHNEISRKTTNLAFDEDDVEMGILRHRLLKTIDYAESLNLLDVTIKARTVIQKDIESAIYKVVDPEKADYALITGIQIHGADGCNYTAPNESYVSISNVRHELRL